MNNDTEPDPTLPGQADTLADLLARALLIVLGCGVAVSLLENLAMVRALGQV